MIQMTKMLKKRQLLKWFSASPLLCAAPVSEVWAQDKGRRPDPMLWTSNTNVDDLIKNPSEAVNVLWRPSKKKWSLRPESFGV
jgi:hypothetical protein